MSATTQRQRDAMHNAKDIIERRRDTLNETEERQFCIFCEVVEEADKTQEEQQAKTRERIRKYRQTPEGKESTRRVNQKQYQKRKEKEKRS